MFTSILWALPFFGILASLATAPLVMPKLWSQYDGAIIGAWCLSLIIPLFYSHGWLFSCITMAHSLFDHYLPFIILVGGLYVIAGGIQITIHRPGTPLMNTIFLALGSLFASILGTTGAAMVLIRPFMQINKHRQNRTHQMVFFIFSIANIGGVLSPIGDPPLFMGFLEGVPFFWPTIHLFRPFLMIFLPLLVIFFCIDQYYYAQEKEKFIRINVKKNMHQGEGSGSAFLKIAGTKNIVGIIMVIGLIIISPLWQTKIIPFPDWTLGDVMRNIGIILIAFLSWKKTNPLIHAKNSFDLHPVKEIAIVFAGIFITIFPVIELLKNAHHPLVCGLHHWLVQGEILHHLRFFWVTGMLSALLDNAPTYLVFFHLAGGDAQMMTTNSAITLMAISLGSVFMGAFTYIGNAPNLMIKSIAEKNNIPMPSFMGYLGWACAILLPLLMIMASIYFAGE